MWNVDDTPVHQVTKQNKYERTIFLQNYYFAQDASYTASTSCLMSIS